MLSKLLLSTAMCLACAAPNIVQLSQSVPDLSTLVTALTAGKLVTALSGAGPFTVFAPTNKGFAKLPAATLANLLKPANIKELDAILEYHVISGAAIYAKDLKPFQMVKTLEGQDLKIVSIGRVIVQNATVTSADNAASNGVVHIIDGVLIPPGAPGPAPAPTPAPTLPNIVQLAQSVPDLSTLVTALTAGKLVGTLSGTGPFTVFAPTNAGFAKLPAATLAHLLNPANIKELDAILEYHVVAGKVTYPRQPNTGARYPNLMSITNQTIDIRIVRCEGNHNCISVEGCELHLGKQNNMASNGVVHILGCVLTPPKPNIVQLAQSVPDLSTLVTAVVAGKLATTLSAGNKKFTVFAPTNEAFANLPAGTLTHLLDPANIKELQSVLLYHVLPEAVQSKDLKPTQAVKTAQGGFVNIRVTPAGGVYVNNAMVSSADNEASNGVVHIINAVLTVPTKSSGNLRGSVAEM